ncbi:MAG: asparagine synthase (glutamine-hydrolyzing) [Thermoplasmata archaeon]|nr:MAG: asparagine synthase (glutamine-hydrolyzing) [Thermoplasmata archaeon]
MCGICGIYNFNQNATIDKSVLKNMCRIIRHRGPDDEGYYTDDKIGLGMRRLSIIDLETGNQPIHNEDESVWIVFNGEIYNFKELRADLETKGHKFYTLSDTESIVHLYEEMGGKCVDKLNGMFAFAIWDSKKNLLLLARDRLGIKPLHYALMEDKILFGSEIKAILQYPDLNLKLDISALNDFLTFEWVPAPKTIFMEIQKLPPGYILTIRKGKAKIEKYWDLDFKEGGKSEEQYEQEIYQNLKRSVEYRMISDVPLGAFLSGGIDSSAIVALMSELSEQPVKTFTIGFADESYNETAFARIIAEQFETEHHEKIIEPNAVDLMEKVVNNLDEPFADVSTLPTYLISEFAREYVKVVLTGDGGDETFGGYDQYEANKLMKKYEKLPNFISKKTIPKIAQKLSPSPQKKGLKNKIKRFVDGAVLPEKFGHMRWMIYLTEDEKISLYAEKFSGKVHDISAYNSVNTYFENNRGKDQLGKDLYVDTKLYLVDDILTKVDRMSMANSLEARVPLLDHNFVGHVATIPSNLKIHNGTRKYIFKKSFRKILPDTILKRGKEGFSIPMKNWLRKELKDLMEDILSAKRLKREGYFNYDYIEKLKNGHLSGKYDHWHKLWALMCFEMWHEKYILNS